MPARLDGDEGWAEAVDGCDHVMHVASPFSADKARRELGWAMRPVDESIKETGHSLIRYGLVKPPRRTGPVTVTS